MITEESAAQAESPTSRFTAVNGAREQLPIGPALPAVMTANMTANGPMSKPGSKELSGQPQATPPRPHERLTISTGSDHDWASRERTNLPSDRQANQNPSTIYSEDGSKQKRKRSGSTEQGSSSANSYHNHGLPLNKETPTTASTVDSENAATSRDSRDEPRRMMSQSDQGYNSEQPYRQFVPNETGQDPPNDSWHARQYPPRNDADKHLGEVLQRASQGMDHQQRQEYDRRTMSDDDEQESYSAYPNDGREMSASSDPKKRKRNFSNRTKTGCMTCRRRKKKCDETRPECNNCQRGGFICSGYQQRGHYPKTEQKQAPVPLQSKDGYDSPIYPAPSPYGNQQLGPRRELPGYRGQALRLDAQMGRDDDHPSSAISAIDNSRLYGSHQLATPNSAYPDRHRQDFARPGPSLDMSRQERDEPGKTRSHMAQLLHPQHHPSDTRSAAQLAELALSHPASRQSYSEKEKMLAGRHYFPFDKELVLERERCNGACWRFNTSTNPLTGVSPGERARLFQDILQPPNLVLSPTHASPTTVVGRVGEDVVVEAPFNCDYGYNISIGREVAIGKNCTILDTCEVRIGDRCNIGPNVSIYTATLPIDPQRRLGTQGQQQGRKVTIESDCWIAGGVTILPGRTIGKGSTVGAGSVVTKDVPPYTVVGGNPAKVLRGVGNQDSS